MGSSYRGLVAPDYADPADVPFAFRQFVDSGPIPRFPNEATRNASLPSPVKGQVAYLETPNKFTFFNGSIWTDMVPPIPSTWPSNQITWVAGSVPSSAVVFPQASLTVRGTVQLTDSLTSTSTTLAPTANAMSKAVNKVATALQTMVGPLKLPAGSAAAPALEIYNDMGFYRTTANALGVAYGNVAIFEFNGSSVGGFGSPGYHTNSGFTEAVKIGMTWAGGTDGGILAVIRKDAAAGFFGRLTNGGVLDFRRSGEQVGTIAVTTSGTAYNTTSDVRLKDNIEDVSKADMLAAILGLRPRSFRWKATGEPAIGLIAQEVYREFPQAVSKPAPGDEGPGYWQLDNSKFVPVLIAAVQELAAQVASLMALEPEGSNGDE